MAKRFTLAEAQSLVPVVDRLMRKAIAAKPEFDEATAALQQFNQRVHVMGGTLVDRESYAAAKSRREQASQRLREALQELIDLGCQIKDLETGLVDFPTLFRGREVFLCWKLGEEAIEFWHGDEGFRGRKPIDQDFLDHHEGDPEQ